MPCLGVSAAKGALLLNLCQRSSTSTATQQPVPCLLAACYRPAAA